MRLLPYGDRAVLAEVADSAQALGLAAALESMTRDALSGAVEIVPGARTVLVRVADPASLARIRSALLALPPLDAEPRAGAGAVRLTVRYDGADLSDVASALGRSVEEVVARHTMVGYTVAFCGFSPGFAYLTGLDPVLHVGRLAEPRTSVPAGSVGIAGEFTGVYPRSSPGGWRLLGRTDAPLWDSARWPPALLTPGTTVRFTPA